MSEVDSARQQLQRTATAFLAHLRQHQCGAACRHTQAKQYTEARARCARIERELLEQLSIDVTIDDATPTERYVQ